MRYAGWQRSPVCIERARATREVHILRFSRIILRLMAMKSWDWDYGKELRTLLIGLSFTHRVGELWAGVSVAPAYYAAWRAYGTANSETHTSVPS